MPLLSSLEEDKKHITRLLKSYGEDTLSYFHLQDERQYFFSPSKKSFLSFKVLNKVAIVANDPVGESSEFPQLFSSFLTYTKVWRLSPCFIGLSDLSLPLSRRNGLQTAKIGEEAILPLTTFERKQVKKKVKRAVRHVEELGIEMFFFSPHTMPQQIRGQIEEISSNWLKNKGGKEKGFSMTLKRLPHEKDIDCVFAVAIQNEHVLGYLCFAPVYKSAGLSLDQSRKRFDAPNGLTEFLIIKSAEYFKEKGIQQMSLNFATFSNLLQKNISLKGLVYKICEKMYQCDSLKSFNEKFSPTWKNRYAAYANTSHLPLYLLAILRAER